MTALRDFQTEFLQKILGDDEISGPLRIYRNNTRLILRDLLKGIFPVTTVLLGEEFMDYAAQEYARAFPPASGDMNCYGESFTALLDRIPSIHRHPYVPDTARLEWLAREAYLSPRMPALPAEDLAAVADPVNLALHLQPHVFLLRSGWPVDRLWERVSAEGAGLTDFEMKAEETFVAVYRDGMGAAVLPLTEGAYKFFECLQTDPSFARAADAALRAQNDLRLDHVLAMALQAGLFMKPA